MPVVVGEAKPERKLIPAEGVRLFTPICKVKEGQYNDGLGVFLSGMGTTFNHDATVVLPSKVFHLCTLLPEEDYDSSVEDGQMQFIQWVDGKPKVVYTSEERSFLPNAGGLYSYSESGFWKALPIVQKREIMGHFLSFVPFSAVGEVVTSLVMSCSMEYSGSIADMCSIKYAKLFKGAIRPIANQVQLMEGRNFGIIRCTLSTYQEIFHNMKMIMEKRMKGVGIEAKGLAIPCNINVSNLLRDGNIVERSAMLGRSLNTDFRQAVSFFKPYAEGCEKFSEEFFKHTKSGTAGKDKLARILVNEVNAGNVLFW